jgi:hypothetical protein
MSARRFRRLATVTAGSVVVGLAAGGIAFAAIPDTPGGIIYGCYPTAAPVKPLLLVDRAGKCPPGFTAMNFNQTGPVGPQGAVGPIGPQGPQGVQGVAGPATPPPARISRNAGTVAIPKNDGYHEATSMALPRGSYLLVAKGHAKGANDGLSVSCDLLNGVEVLDRGVVLSADGSGIQMLSLADLVEMPSDGTIRMACATSRDGIDVFDVKLVATAVTPF